MDFKIIFKALAKCRTDQEVAVFYCICIKFWLAILSLPSWINFGLPGRPRSFATKTWLSPFNLPVLQDSTSVGLIYDKTAIPTHLL